MVGELVIDRFRVLERIGSGGMGTVYRALDERLQRHVAVKEIPGAGADRVLREAHAAARLNHPGIVTLYELGAFGDSALLVSELVEGQTLAELAQSGHLSDRDVAELGADVSDALEHAHSRGVVHRDVKPQNVIVRDDADAGRRAKLADFGIAQLAGAPSLTATGEVVGTLAYMAPEQAEGERAGEAADVYSLALTLYECWAGANPVARPTPAATARAIGTALPSLREYRPDLPPHLTERVDACLLPAPEQRPPLDALHSALAAALPDLDGERAVPVPDAARPDAPTAPSLLLAPLAASLASCALLAYLAGPGGHPEAATLIAIAGGLVAALLGTGRALVLPAVTVALAGLVASGGDAAIAPIMLALSALSFAPILRLGHVALALLGALLWAAGLEGLLRVAGSGGIAGPPQLVAAFAAVAVLVEFRGRGHDVPATRPRRAPRRAPVSRRAAPSRRAPSPGSA
jgi:eukaryotic-like serine/threonine-protein kinase